MAIIPGAIPVTGFLGPTDSTDTYAVTDAKYGIDGLRNVADTTERDAITPERRRKNMIVGTQNDGTYWRLLTNGPWNFDATDWAVLIAPGPGPVTPGLWELSGSNITTGSSLTTPNVLPYTNVAQDLGSATKRWKDLYIQNVIEFDSILDFNISGSPVIELSSIGLTVDGTKGIGSNSSANRIDLDFGGSGGMYISTDAGSGANNSFVSLNDGPSGQFTASWGSVAIAGSIILSSIGSRLSWTNGTQTGSTIINSTAYTISHNVVAKFDAFAQFNTGFYFKDTTGVKTVDTNNRQLTSAANVLSLDWTSRLLKDTAAANSSDWGARIMYDGSAVESMRWGTRLLKDTAAVNSADWGARTLADTSAALSIDWANRRLYKTGAVVALDWALSRAYVGSTAVIDWAGYQLADTSNRALNWTQRILYDQANTPVLRWTSGNVHLFSSNLTGSSMTGLNLSVNAAVSITSTSSIAVKSASGYGLNVNGSNITTLTGSTTNISGDSGVTIFGGTGGQIDVDSFTSEAVLISTDAGTAANNTYLFLSNGPTGQSTMTWSDDGSTELGTVDISPGSGTSMTYTGASGNGSIIVSNGGALALNASSSIIMTSPGRQFTFDPVGSVTFTDTAGKGIEYAGNYAATFTARSLVDKAYVDTVAGSGLKKYATSFAFTGGTAHTFTHSLGSTDVMVEIKNASGQKVWGAAVDTYTTNTVNVTVSVTGTYRVIVIG